jgi:hypothetical protein
MKNIITIMLVVVAMIVGCSKAYKPQELTGGISLVTKTLSRSNDG